MGCGRWRLGHRYDTYYYVPSDQIDPQAMVSLVLRAQNGSGVAGEPLWGAVAMGDLETFIPLEDAAKKYDLHIHLLTDLVERGKIKAVRINRRIAVAEEEVFNLVKEMTGDGRKYAALEGKPIRVTKAARKYQMSHATLSKWAKRGYIRVIEQGPKLLLLNEADVARARDLAERLEMKGGRGVIKGPVYSV